MKKVTLLGDSIRMIGYGKTVADALNKEGVEIFQPEENCRFSKYTLRMLFDYKAQIAGSDVIHWNNGLWDVCDLAGDGPFTPKEVYADFVLRTLRVLKRITPNIIFATTTPVDSENHFNSNPVIEAYNAFIVPKLEAEGVVINDLHALVAPDIDRFIRKDDHIHLTDDGIDVCAAAVAAKIRALAE